MKTMFRVSSFLLTTGILVGSFVGFWYGPWSPNLDHRARNLIVQDHLQEGVDLFLWKAEYALSKEAKHEALWNAARTASLRSESSIQIRHLLNRCLEEEDFIYRAEVHAQLATLLFEEQPRESIKHWEWALYYGHQKDESVTWRVRLAMALEAEGKMVEAIDVWEEALGYPNSARMAHMVLGRLLLDDDPDMSVYHFQKAKQLTEQQQDQAAELGFRVAQFEVEYMENLH